MIVPQRLKADAAEVVDAAHLQGRTPGGEVVLQLSGTEEGRMQHSHVPQQPVQVWCQPRLASHAPSQTCSAVTWRIIFL